MKDTKILKDDELETVTGGGSSYWDQLGNLETGKWYIKRDDNSHIYKVLSILVTIDNDGYCTSSSIMLARYWFNGLTGKAWNHGTVTDSGSNDTNYEEHAAPFEFDNAMTVFQPF